MLWSHRWKDEDLKLYYFLFMKDAHANSEGIWQSQGWTVTPEKKKSKRILVMGDSFVVGDGLSNMNDIWWRQLQKELQRRGYNDVEVIACGNVGGSTAVQLQTARKVVPIYKPDLIIWGYVTNDPQERTKTGTSIVPLPLKRNTPTEKANEATSAPLARLLPNLWEQLASLRANRGNGPSRESLTKQYDDWELRLLEGENFERYKVTVKDLGEFLRSVSVPSFIMTLPAGVGRDPTTYDADVSSGLARSIKNHYDRRYKRVEPLFAQNKIRFINLLDDFVNALSTDVQLKNITSPLSLAANPANGHPGPYVTHFYAVKAADVIEASYSRCIGRQSAPSPFTTPRINDWEPPNLGTKPLNDNAVVFDYPSLDNYLLFMPIRQPHVQLSLERAAPLAKIKLHGPGLEEANVYVTSEDRVRHYDDGSLHQLGMRKGHYLEWKLPDEDWSDSVSTLRIHAKCNGVYRLLLELYCKPNPSESNK